MMNKRKAKLPDGLFYRERKRADGTVAVSTTIYCFYYVPARRQPIVKNTRTTDADQALHYLRKLQSEHPAARAQRIEADKVTVHDALANLRADREARGVWSSGHSSTA